MDRTNEVREFLTTRRARLQPADAGLPAAPARRRVPGLRREEVALLSQMSVDYYTRLERGNLSGVSDSVLESLARALQLDTAETEHLFDLARTANAGSRPRRGASRSDSPAGPAQVRPVLGRILEALGELPALITSDCRDVLAANRLGRALYSPVFAGGEEVPNLARFAFLDPAARTFYPDWEELTRDQVASIRQVAGRHPFDKQLTDLVGELATRSEVFARLWGQHDVRFHRTGSKRLRHPEIGVVQLDYEAMTLPADPRLSMSVFTPHGEADADRLALLAMWAQDQSVPTAADAPSES